MSLPKSAGVCVEMSSTGGPEVLRETERALTKPGRGEVRVKVMATGVAFADVKMRHGIYPGIPKFPFVPGYDFAGIVEQIGAGVNDFRMGDRVAGLSFVGANAERITLSAKRVSLMPETVSFDDAAAGVLNYLTAYQMLHRNTQIEDGQVVLVHGGAGGVGTALLDLLKDKDVQVFATASHGKHSVVEGYGATPIDYKEEDFVDVIKRQTSGADVVLDHLGGSHLWRSRKALKSTGKLICYGFADSVASDDRMAGVKTVGLIGLIQSLPGPSAAFYAILSKPFSFEDHISQDLAAILKLMGEGRLKPKIGARLPLAEAPKAHAMLENAEVSGKILLIP